MKVHGKAPCGCDPIFQVSVEIATVREDVRRHRQALAAHGRQRLFKGAEGLVRRKRDAAFAVQNLKRPAVLEKNEVLRSGGDGLGQRVFHLPQIEITGSAFGKVQVGQQVERHAHEDAQPILFGLGDRMDAQLAWDVMRRGAGQGR